MAPPPTATILTDERATLLIAGPAKQAADLADRAEQAGLRCIGQLALDALAERLGRIVAVDLVLVDLRGTGADDGLDPVTARALAGRHGLARSRLAVLTDLAGIDCAMAWLDSPDTEFLCEPQASDVASLLALAALSDHRSDRQPTLHDATHESEGARLERLSDEVRRLAVTIERLTQGNHAAPPRDDTVMEARGSYRVGHHSDGSGNGLGNDIANGHGRANGKGNDAGSGNGFGLGAAPPRTERFHPREPRVAAPADDEAAISHGEIRALLRARRLREQFLPADLFADPAWDMILDLMAARLAGQRVSVSSLCIAASVPPTTALRWIGQLTERGVFSRIDDPADGRRVFIALTDGAADAVEDWARAVRRNGGLLA